MFIFNFNVVLFCHPAPELSPVSLTKLGLCRGTEEKQAFLQFLKKVAVENGFLRALADIRKIQTACSAQCANMLVASRGTDL